MACAISKAGTLVIRHILQNAQLRYHLEDRCSSYIRLVVKIDFILVAKRDDLRKSFANCRHPCWCIKVKKIQYTRTK